MKKGILAITLLISGALLVTPITNASTVSAKDKQETTLVEQNIDSKKEAGQEVTLKEEQNEVKVENETISQLQEQKVPAKENKENNSKDEIIEEKIDENKEDKNEETSKVEAVINEEKEIGLSKSEAEAIVKKYIKDVEKSDFSFTYQGDENTFQAIKDKKMKGYVFLPNIETDMAYFVDKESGNIYYFHPSGYFELLQ